MKCPRCGGKSTSTGKKWKYGVFDVELEICEECKKKFNVYYIDGKFKYTIPKYKN